MFNTDALPELVFDARSRRWRYRDSRAFASMDAVRSLSRSYGNQEKLVLQQLGNDYSNGYLSISELQEELAKVLKQIHLAAMVRGLGRQTDLNPARFLLVGRNLKQQYYAGIDPLTGDRFGIKYLIQDIVAGRVSPAQLQNRLRMFGESDKITYWGTQKAIATDNGVQYARRVLGASENCPQCRYYASLGVMPLRDVVIPGVACQCRTNCKCRIEFVGSKLYQIRIDACAEPIRDEQGRYAGCAVGAGGGGGSRRGGGGGGSAGGGVSTSPSKRGEIGSVSTRDLQRQLKEELDIERRSGTVGYRPTPELNTRDLQMQLRDEMEKERRRRRLRGKTNQPSEIETSGSTRRSRVGEVNEDITKQLQQQIRAELEAELQRAYGAKRKAKPKAKQRAKATTTTETDKPKAKATAKPKAKKKEGKGDDNLKIKIAPRERPAGDINHFKIDPSTGKASIWKGTEYAQFNPTFKVKRDRNHEYKVTYKGQNLTLNDHKTTMSLSGETIRGVPPLLPKLKEAKDQTLFDSLARTMSHVENKTTPPPAPDWKPTLHGKIDKQYVRSAKGQGDYGKMQIHHVNQWSKKRFDEITDRYERKELTLDQAKAEMRRILVSDSGSSNGLAIDIQRRADRELVVLAAGTHDINSPLYSANHPMGIHPDTGKKVRFGIPKTGDGGREWFNEFRGDFWREYYRRESNVIGIEINRRIRDGQLTPSQADQMWRDAHAKVVKSNEWVREQRNKAEEHNKKVREARKAKKEAEKAAKQTEETANVS